MSDFAWLFRHIRTPPPKGFFTKNSKKYFKKMTLNIPNWKKTKYNCKEFFFNFRKMNGFWVNFSQNSQLCSTCMTMIDRYTACQISKIRIKMQKIDQKLRKKYEKIGKNCRKLLKIRGKIEKERKWKLAKNCLRKLKIE